MLREYNQSRAQRQGRAHQIDKLHYG